MIAEQLDFLYYALHFTLYYYRLYSHLYIEYRYWPFGCGTEEGRGCWNSTALVRAKCYHTDGYVRRQTCL
eukprot:scaffold283870_cov32-Tisochrysis_lutea.AAC.1